MNPLISIIIPTFNRSNLIDATLDSVLQQTYQNWECIVVDDGSTDKTHSILNNYDKKDARFAYYHRPKNRLKGANACRNYGFELSKGEYIVFLDSDDLLSENCIEDRVLIALNNPSISISVFKMQRFFVKPLDSSDIVNRYSEKKEDYLFMFLKHNIPWQLTSMFIKSNMLKVRFNEQLQRFQDVEFSTKLLFKTRLNHIKILKESNPDCFYRIQKRHSIYSINFIKLISKSLLEYFKSIDAVINTYNDDKIAYKKFRDFQFIFYLKIYSKYILPNIADLKTENHFLKRYMFLNKYINRVDLLRLKILEFIYLKKLENVKGIGIYRLSRRWIK